MVNETLWNLSSAYRRLFRWKRWVQLIVIFVTHISESIYLKLRWKATHRGSPPTAGERLRRLFERLGPAYIKFAQVLSNRPEVPEDVLKELKKLQDKVPGFPYEQVEEQVKKELGAPIDEIYLYFEKEPIAAASIGQVHRAVLKNGEKVAVKIQRPNIQYLIENDIDIMVTMVRVAEFFSEAARIFNFRPTLEAFKVATLRELDYIIEGRSADKFRKLFAKDAWIHIPRVYWEHTSKRVLTLEFIDGVKIDQTDELIKMGCNRRTISINSVRAFMKQIFEGGFFHADPHPANVFIMKNNVIALLDFGMVGSAPKETLDAFTDVLLATLARDVDRIMERMLEIYKPSEYTNLPQLRADLQDFVDRAFDVDGHLAVNQLGIGSFMDEIMFRFAKHRLEVPSEMIYLGKVMMYAEGTGKMLDPTFDIVSVVQPYIQRYAAEQVQRRLDPFGFRNPAKLLQDLFEFTSDMGDLVRALPRSANAILTRIEKGELKVQFESQEMDQWNHSMGRVLHHQMALTALIAILILVFVFVTVRGGKLF